MNSRFVLAVLHRYAAVSIHRSRLYASEPDGAWVRTLLLERRPDFNVVITSHDVRRGKADTAILRRARLAQPCSHVVARPRFLDRFDEPVVLHKRLTISRLCKILAASWKLRSPYFRMPQSWPGIDASPRILATLG